MKEHKHLYGIKNSYLEKSIRKHGWGNFKWEILYECEEKDLDDEEKKFIALYNTYYKSYNGGYNLTRGGEMKGKGNPMRDPELAKKQADSNRGKKRDIDFKVKMSQKVNTTGFYRVIKEKCPNCKQGFIYRYEIRKQNIRVRASDIHKLQEKVLEKGHDWHIINQELAEKTIQESESKRINKEKEHPTGYYGVIKRIDNTYLKGHYFRYRGQDSQGKSVYIQATTIPKLKEKVLAKGLKWIVLKDNDNHKHNLGTLDFWL